MNIRIDLSGRYHFFLVLLFIKRVLFVKAFQKTMVHIYTEVTSRFFIIMMKLTEHLLYIYKMMCCIIAIKE